MKTIFVNGTFDMLHPGHRALLNFAATLGDRLIVAIDSDERVLQRKGRRPVFNEWERQNAIRDMTIVDGVLWFDDDDMLTFILKGLKPDILVCGIEYKDKPIIGIEHVGRVEYWQSVGETTTDIIKRIKQLSI